MAMTEEDLRTLIVGAENELSRESKQLNQYLDQYQSTLQRVSTLRNYLSGLYAVMERVKGN